LATIGPYVADNLSAIDIERDLIDSSEQMVIALEQVLKSAPDAFFPAKDANLFGEVLYLYYCPIFS